MGIEGEMSNGGMQDEKDEVMIRRMKNRERQRRYRARKRMREEAGINGSLSFETMGLHEEEEEEEEEDEEEELQFNGLSGGGGYVDNFVRRVYCDRDWKKEARRAHLFVNKAQDGSCDLVKRKIRRHQRDWKADARKKKT